MQTIGHNGNQGLSQGNSAGQSRKGHQQEEYEAQHHSRIAHAGEHLRQGDEHQRRTRRSGGATGNNEGGGNNHEASNQGNHQVKAGNAGNRRGQVLLLGYIGAVGDHDAHGQRQAVEHLTHGVQQQVGAELAKVGNQVVLDTLNSTRLHSNVHGNANGHNQQSGHHNQVGFLNAVLNTQGNNQEHQRHEHQHPGIAFGGAVQEAHEEVASISQRSHGNMQERHHELDNPAANDAVVGRDDERHQRGQNTNKLELAAQNAKSANARKLGVTTQGNLKQQQGNAKGESQSEVREDERTAAKLRGQVRESPHVAQANGRSSSSQDKCGLI